MRQKNKEKVEGGKIPKKKEKKTESSKISATKNVGKLSKAFEKKKKKVKKKEQRVQIQYEGSRG